MAGDKTIRKVRVRTYRHGLGDCHLVSFAKPNGGLFHVLIDCGVVDRTPNAEALMTGVAQDIAKEAQEPEAGKAVLDLVIATHQHTDHLSGFRQAQAEFDKMQIKRLWLAWTEDKVKGKQAKRQLERGLAAARQALAKMQELKCEAAPRVQGVLDFFGALGADGERTQAVLDYLQGRPGIETSYHDPGTCFLMPEVPNVRVYVLGPPTDLAMWKITNPRKGKHEGYEDASLTGDAEGFITALVPALCDEADERSFPFAEVFRKSGAEAQQNPFFQKYYGFDAQHGEAWRRIDTSWLECAERLALAVNNLTNNTSLALAFEFVDSGEVLLFPGDAQIGSWLSWQHLMWKVKDNAGQAREVRIGDLFANTVFYKASHHASHNGTLSDLGLEEMKHRDLVAFVPVDRAMSKKKHWDRTLPWQPLLDRLAEQCRGRLVLTDLAEPPPVPKDLVNLTLAERVRFQQQVVAAKEWVDFLL